MNDHEIIVTNIRTGRIEKTTLRKAIWLQRLMGIALIALGILAAVLEPSEGFAATILFSAFGIPCILAKKANVIYFDMVNHEDEE